MSTALTVSSALKIHEIRGEPVVLDQDVARLFGVETRRLNEQVTRNEDKFGNDFAFRLTHVEFTNLMSQIATSSEVPKWGGVRKAPRVFTEHGVVMAATVLKSPQAIHAVRHVVKVFIQTRHAALAASHGDRKAADANQAVLPLDAGMRQGLMTKLNMALGFVLDAIIDPKEETAVRDEARAIAAEGLKAIKAYLKKAGIQNEKTLAEVRKIMAEAENIEVKTAGKRTENQHKQLALLAKKLKLVIQAQHYAETGSVAGLLQVLGDLEQA